jgi:dimethylamine/trimethylamine dehydrogenase
MARDPKYDLLFEPIAVGPKTLKNRFYQVPHANGAGSDAPGDQAAFRAVKAEGGWAGVNTGWCSISPGSDASGHVSCRLWDEGDIINLRPLCDEVHKYGALAGCELGHYGVHAPNLESREASRGPGAYQSDVEPWVYCAEADDDEIAEIVELHAEAARRAVAAGFDIVYYWPADSMLGTQFLSPFYNHRTDKYGGDFDGRIRFSLEVLEATRKAVGDSAAVAVRHTVDNLLGPDGIEAGDEGLRYVERITAEGLADLWDVKIGSYADFGDDIATSRFQKANHEKPFNEGVKAIAGGVPVVAVGRLTSPDDMVANIAEGVYDIVGAARASIADPFLPNKVAEGRMDDIRECIGCNMCIVTHESHAGRISCTQNATVMEEYRRGWHPERFEPAPDPCSVLVVGSGPAGLECARVLGMRGYDVHLREAEGDLGGHIRDVMRYPGLAEWGRIVSYRQTQLEKMKTVEIHTGVGRMSADDVLGYGADRVVIATGARWSADGTAGVTMAAIDGADAARPQIATPEQVMAGKELGERVVVIDGEGVNAGMAMAELCADLGKQVTLVTQLADVAAFSALSGEYVGLRRLIHEKDIATLTSHWVESIEVANTVRIETFNLYRDGYRRKPAKTGDYPREMSGETTTLECDSVILATSRIPDDALYRELKARRDEWEETDLAAVVRAGDCVVPRLIYNTVFDGHRLAREFESENPERPLPYIRERRIWGDDTMSVLNR